MLLLALERSTRFGSLAVYHGRECLWFRQGPTRTAGGGDACTVVDAALRALRLRPSSLDCLVCGLGPGSFSGIRAGLAFLHGMALPSAIPVEGISSAAALAWEALRADATGSVAVVGDARRGRYWIGTFQKAGTVLTCRNEITAASADEMVRMLPDDIPVVSPDVDRIGESLALALAPRPLLREFTTPRADALAEVALHSPDLRVRPPLPIYVHPAVVGSGGTGQV